MPDNVTEKNLEVPEEVESPEDLNQVIIRSKSGHTYNVRYIIRHPRREWLYAHRATGHRETDGGYAYQYNEMVLRADAIESIEMNETSFPSSVIDGDTDEYFFRVDHSEPIDNVPIGTEIMKAFINEDAELENLLAQQEKIERKAERLASRQPEP